MQIKHNLTQLAIAVDQFANVLVSMFVEPNKKAWSDMTLSANCYAHSLNGRWTIPMWIIDHMFFWQDEHCKQAYESELERAHLPPSVR